MVLPTRGLWAHMVKDPLEAVFVIGFLLLCLFLTHLVYETKQFETAVNTLIAVNMKKLKTLVQTSNRPVTALITGANSGIGLQLATRIASVGVVVILGCRSKERGLAAAKKITTKYPKAKVKLLLIDVESPSSVISAARRLMSDPSFECDHLDYLFLNAGVMPVSRYRWEVLFEAFTKGGLFHFFETSRTSSLGACFLEQPIDSVGYGGCPQLLATHVLGHLLLIQELQPIMGPLKNSGSNVGGDRIGRIIWTGSRSATNHKLDWEYLTPPESFGQLSGFQKQLLNQKAEQLDTYGQAKHCQDLLNAALGRHVMNPCLIICPGFVDTELTPSFMRLGNPFFILVRKHFPYMSITGARGTAAHISMMITDPHLLRSDRKYVLGNGVIHPAINGYCISTEEEQERFWNICMGWMRVWKEGVAMEAKENR